MGVVMTIPMANPGDRRVNVRVTMGVIMTIHMAIPVGVNVDILMIPRALPQAK